MATYYSSHNAAGGGAGTVGDPFTLQELFDTCTTGDTGYILNTGTYTPSVTLDIDINTGSNVQPLHFIGVNASDGITKEMVTISGSSLGAGDDLLDFGITGSYCIMEYLRLTAATRYNVYADQNNLVLIFKNCRVDSATSHGMYCSSSNQEQIFIDSEIDSNGGSGYDVLTSARGGIQTIRCAIHDNTGDGIRDGQGSLLGQTKKPLHIGSVFYNNGGDGLEFIGSGGSYGGGIIDNCVFFNNTGNGLSIVSTHGFVSVSRSIFRSNGGYGIYLTGGYSDILIHCDYNDSSNNTSGAIDVNGGVLPGVGNITIDPQFVSEIDGSEDFTPQNANLYIQNTFPGGVGGTSYEYIGAIQPKRKIFLGAGIVLK